MDKPTLYSNLWKIAVAVTIFCYLNFYVGDQDWLVSLLATLSLIGFAELFNCVASLIYQGYKHIPWYSFYKNKISKR